MIALLSAAWAATVQCDPSAASALSEAARIAPDRAPVSHPELIPGLALADPNTPPDLREALSHLCAGASTLSLTPTDRWEQADGATYAWRLARTERVGCALSQQGIALSVAVERDGRPSYRLIGHLPLSRTPVGDCDTPAAWREERVILGANGPVRIAVATEWEGESLVHSEVLVRRADATGWSEQVLLSPAPGRYLNGAGGPRISLLEGSDPWIVAHGDHSALGETCEATPGQTVWRWEDGWTAIHDRPALGLLAERGAWRLASDDGWFLVLAVLPDDEYPEILQQRLAWHASGWSEPLHLYRSSSFPGLNPGFWIIAPAPWPTRVEALEARRRGSPWRRSYVKRGWIAPDPCAP